MTRQLLAQYILLFEMSGGEDLERLVNFERQTMRMAVRLTDTRVRATYDFGQKVKQTGHHFLRESAEVHTTGLIYLMGIFLDEIINGQRMGLVTDRSLVNAAESAAHFGFGRLPGAVLQ